jgi:hypothetical protein
MSIEHKCLVQTDIYTIVKDASNNTLIFYFFLALIKIKHDNIYDFFYLQVVSITKIIDLTHNPPLSTNFTLFRNQGSHPSPSTLISFVSAVPPLPPWLLWLLHHCPSPTNQFVTTSLPFVT